MNTVKILEMVDYLQLMESKSDFLPWDDDEHAQGNLMTVFDCHPSEAREAVKLAGVSTKEQK